MRDYDMPRLTTVLWTAGIWLGGLAALVGYAVVAAGSPGGMVLGILVVALMAVGAVVSLRMALMPGWEELEADLRTALAFSLFRPRLSVVQRLEQAAEAEEKARAA